MQTAKSRIAVWVACTAMGFGVIILLHFGLDPDSVYAKLLIDRGGELYPFSEQNLMWIVLFCGFGEIVLAMSRVKSERKHMVRDLLPEDESTMLQSQDLAPIYQKLSPDGRPIVEQGFLPRLIARAILQFQSSRSIDQANSLMNSSLEMFMHEIDLRYSMLRYISWTIPTLGFIGTVRGIALGLQKASDNAESERLLTIVTEALSVAFYTTLLALLMSIVLVLLMTVVQSLEEKTLNQGGQYCLDNLINRLYEN